MTAWTIHEGDDLVYALTITDDAGDAQSLTGATVVAAAMGPNGARVTGAATITNASGGVVTVVWLGMDDNRSLGRQEQGGRTALPLWVDFMETALEGRPERDDPMPVGLTRALIDPNSGLRVRPGTDGAVTEWFHADNLPPLAESAEGDTSTDPYEIY